MSSRSWRSGAQDGTGSTNGFGKSTARAYRCAAAWVLPAWFRIAAMIPGRVGQFFEERVINDDMGIVDAASLWDWVIGGAGDSLSRGAKGLPVGANVVYRG